jgi:hypothetical protein
MGTVTIPNLAISYRSSFPAHPIVTYWGAPDGHRIIRRKRMFCQMISFGTSQNISAARDPD